MAERSGPVAVAELLDRLRLLEDPARELELAARLPAASDPRAVSVTDLLATRRAFWRRLRGPAPVSPDRELRIERGRAWHRRLGPAVAAEGRFEVHLRRGGITARIDLLADVPVEVKTTSSPDIGSLQDDRPDQVEQLASYCALTGRSAGRLVHLLVRDDGPPRAAAVDLEFRDLGAIEAELLRREEALRGAVATRSPVALGRCRWYPLGCDYRSAGVCDCAGDEPEEPTEIGDRLVARTERPEIAARWEEALRATPSPDDQPVSRFRDLLHPRRAYFDRRVGRPPVAQAPRPASAPADAYERTVAALERGPVGEVHALPPKAGGPEEEVLAWRGEPCLVRSSRVRTRLTPQEVRARFPQYLVDLGFRCALTGVPRGTLVVAREVVAAGDPPVEVLSVDFAGEVAAFAALWDERRAALARAIVEAAPTTLPACPAWMAAECPYREACGCAEAPGRSQR